ncbi:cytochrome c biogenesis CcdA family protein [Haliangium sp.]|uniref:cytochrome c biogenesis CcdA family protein n=1 Tax=Haliangium sp. TaxID=2663208 RepID=UPI003D0BC969
MKELAELLSGALSGGNLVALPLVIAGGVVTGFNPCCIPLYPAAAATCCATRGDRARVALGASLAFVAGVALATTVLGVVAALAGRTMLGVGGWVRYLIALVPLAMAVHVLGWVRIPLPAFVRAGPRGGVRGSFLAGLALSFVLAPCGTPVLASVLTYAAYQGSVVYGAILLFLFGLGAGIPVLLIGTVAGGLGTRLDWAGFQRWVDRVTGVLLLGVGFYLLWSA